VPFWIHYLGEQLTLLARPKTLGPVILAAVLSLLFMTAAPAATAAAGATISGTVSVPAGADVKNAFVAISGTNYSRQIGVSADGSYRFDELAAGSYTVRFDYQSWPSPDSIRPAPQWYKGGARFSQATSVTLAAGQSLAGISGTLDAGAFISGRLTLPSGVDAAKVRIVASETGNASYLHSATVYARADGSYVLNGLPPGRYQLSFSSQDRAGGGIVSSYYGGATEAAATVLDVPHLGGINNVDQTLTAAGAVGGTVTVPEGISPAGIFVSAYPQDGSTSVPSARTDAGGNFDIGHVKPGTYKLAFEASGLEPQWYGQTGSPDDSPVLTVDAGQAVGGLQQTIQLTASASPLVFADVPPGTQFEAEINWLAGQGISTGWVEPNGTKTYRPLWPVNRDAMAAFMYRLSGKPDFWPPPVSPFADLAPSELYFKEIIWLTARNVSTGWVDGNGTRTFRPSQPVNRDAMAAFMYRLAGRPAFDPPAVSPFADVTTDNVYYHEITWLAAQDISTGWKETDGTRTFRPYQAVNRDAMAAFMYRFASKFTPV
jgi:hypothetical protein